MRYISILLTCLIFSNLGHSQGETLVAHFKSGDKVFIENIESFAANPDIPDEDVVDGVYYRYVQFNSIPVLTVQNELINSGLQLVEYVPDNIYLVAFPQNYSTSDLLNYDIRSVVPVDVEDKLDLRLIDRTWPDWANSEGGRVKVMIKSFPGIAPNIFLSKLSEELSYEKSGIHFPFVFATLHPSEFERIASLPFVQFLDIGPDPGTPEDTGGRTLQRANLINSLLPGGLRYDATGVSVQVRDDGVVGPHIDFEGRLFDYTGGSNTGTHGDGVAGVFAGAGNREQDVAGAASGADVYVTNYESEFLDNTIQLHEEQNVVITNSSYSNGCNAGYTSTTQRVDQQMNDHPHLMHVFSAGNSNNNNCGYGAGTQWGNITGGHKQGKNVMAVANLFADGSLVNSSSRGPAHDGRIKPDISAHGQNERSTSTNNTYQTFGGTSSAAPTMAGSYAQLYQAYRDLNGGADPNTGFLKAVVLNSAFDKGNKGPDFKFGWGRIDAYKGYEILRDQTYVAGWLEQGQFRRHTINIPAGVAEARIMVYWVDPAGAVNSSRALVNDLDIFVTDPSSSRHNPWVLDHTPNPATLDLPATRGADHLNNMEQVQIDNPAAGNYELRIDGTAIPLGRQTYFVVWSFFYDEIKVTYPLGGEGFLPGEIRRIHWDAYGDQGTFSLDYSTNNGGSWIPIVSGLSGSTRQYNWVVPTTTSSIAKVRVSRGGQSDQSDETFAIFPYPSNLSFSNSCNTGATLSWGAVNGAAHYEVLRLGEKYMEVVGTTTGTTYTFNDLQTGSTEWFTVRAVTTTGAKSRRADAIPFFADPLLVNCRNTIELVKTTDLSTYKAGDTIEYTIQFTSYYDDPIDNVTITDILGPTWKYIDGSLTCGSINGQTVTLNHGTVQPDQSITCSFKVRSDVLLFTEPYFSDDLESGTGNWVITNTRGPETWALTTQQSNSPSHSWFTPNVGSVNTQAIVTHPMPIREGSELIFHHNYITESGWDGGFVEITIDNGLSWHDLGPYMILNGYNGGLGNGANPDIGSRSAFTGNSGGFIETQVDLSDFGNSTAMFRFTFGEDGSVGGTGWYIDDISIRTVYYQENSACVTFDQGSEVCTSVVSLMLPCEVNCDSCSDGIRNGDESEIDCGGSLCTPCPCTQVPTDLVYMNEVIPDGTDERIKNDIFTNGFVLTGSNSSVTLRAGNEIFFDPGFRTGEATNLTVQIEDCQE